MNINPERLLKLIGKMLKEQEARNAAAIQAAEARIENKFLQQRVAELEQERKA